MPASEDKRTTCPHCGELYYPLWNAVDILAPPPNRRDELRVGRLWATTCTACDRPIIEIDTPKEGETFLTTIQGRDSYPVFPAEPEWVIKIIIQVFIDFENLRRQQASDPEMTEEEQNDRRRSLHEFFSGIWETVKTHGDTAETMGKYLSFFEQLTKFLPPV